MYRLVALDLDGTLLTPQKTITPRTHTLLCTLITVGVHVVIATGQTYKVLQAVCADLPLTGPQILHNGALIADLHSGEIYHECLLPPPLILTGLQVLRDLHLNRAYYTPDAVYVDINTPNSRNWYRPPVPPAIEVEDVCTLYPQPCIKLMGVGDPSTLREKRSMLETRFAGHIYVTQVSRDLLELLHPSVSKGAALQTIASMLHINPDEIIAIGDNHNDIGMLRFAGLGIAMGNAHEEIKTIADMVTLSNAEEGVAHALEQIFADLSH